MKVGPSFADVSVGRTAQGIKVLTEGGVFFFLSLSTNMFLSLADIVKCVFKVSYGYAYIGLYINVWYFLIYKCMVFLIKFIKTL